MPSRRFHGKTRTGCTACKARHVKCGEERPICHHCHRRNTPCIYPTDSQVNSNQRHNNVQHRQHGSPTSTSPNDSLHLSRPPSNGFLPAEDSFDSLDLSLMHRYATSTATRLYFHSEAQPFWQFAVPSMAESSSILQRGILALAAMDLACEAACDPVEKNPVKMAMYRSRSLYHQQKALPQFRSLLERPDQSHADQQTILIFSIFLLFLAFASAHSAEAKPTIDEILDLFALFRGPKMLWAIAEGNSKRDLIDAIFPTPLAKQADVLENSNIPQEEPYPRLRALPLDDAATIALDKLSESYKFSQLVPTDVRCMAWFPALAPDAFCMQVRQRQPNALAILAQFVGILRPFRELWWVRTWDLILDEAINEELRKGSISLPDQLG